MIIKFVIFLIGTLLGFSFGFYFVYVFYKTKIMEQEANFIKENIELYDECIKLSTLVNKYVKNKRKKPL